MQLKCVARGSSSGVRGMVHVVREGDAYRWTVINEIGDPRSVWSRCWHRFSQDARMGEAHLGAYILCSLERLGDSHSP